MASPWHNLVRGNIFATVTNAEISRIHGVLRIACQDVSMPLYIIFTPVRAVLPHVTGLLESPLRRASWVNCKTGCLPPELA